jgi:hypothetical protein
LGGAGAAAMGATPIMTSDPSSRCAT